jgi:hypothetical protein
MLSTLIWEVPYAGWFPHRLTRCPRLQFTPRSLIEPQNGDHHAICCSVEDLD